MNYDEILNLFVSDEHPTIRLYLKDLLIKLWREGEGFSGKRPFGDSGWERDLYFPLVKAGVVHGVLDEFNDFEELDTPAADTLVFKLIDHIFKESK